MEQPNLSDMTLDEQIDEQIRKIDRLESHLVNMQRNRPDVSDRLLLHKYDQLEEAKRILASMQLDHIDQTIAESEITG